VSLTDRPVSKEGVPCVTGVNRALLWWGEDPGLGMGWLLVTLSLLAGCLSSVSRVSRIPRVTVAFSRYGAMAREAMNAVRITFRHGRLAGVVTVSGYCLVGWLDRLPLAISGRSHRAMRLVGTRLLDHAARRRALSLGGAGTWGFRSGGTRRI
jgi:hypothetical protein